ncbi:hypothetical protein ES703_17723 [subsurface metagenome]
MSNGQFHQKNQKKRRYGVKIKNPLRLPVNAIIRCKTGAIRSGAMNGTETTRTIGPRGEIFVSTKGACELDIDIGIIRYDETGRTKMLGNGDAVHVDHRDPMGKQMKPGARVPTRVTEEKKRVPALEEEVEIPSLGDMMREFDKEGVKV